MYCNFVIVLLQLIKFEKNIKVYIDGILNYRKDMFKLLIFSSILYVFKWGIILDGFVMEF